MYEKEGEKIEKYQDLKREIGRLRGIRHLEVVLVIIIIIIIYIIYIIIYI